MQLPQISFGQVEDITGLLELVYAGEMVDAQQVRMLIRFLQTCLAYDEIHHQLPMDIYPRLNDAASAWQPLSQLASLTRRLFNEEGEVRDSASPALSEIRAKLARIGVGRRIVLRQIGCEFATSFGNIESLKLDTRKRWARLQIANPSDKEIRAQLRLKGLWGGQFEVLGKTVQGVEGEARVFVTLPKKGTLEVEARVME